MSLVMGAVNKVGMLLKKHERDTKGTTQTYDDSYVRPEPFKLANARLPWGFSEIEIGLPTCRGFMLSQDDYSGTRVVYHLHGGGFIDAFTASYNNDTAVRYSRAAGGADVFSLDYRTAPEYPYPCALDDAVSGYHWLLECGYSAQNIIVAGDSAGGGLSLSLCMRLRDEGDELPAALVLASPWADLACEGESYRRNATVDICFGSYYAEDNPVDWFSDSYVGDADPHDPYVSPAYGDFTSFPPMLIQVGGDEMLLSDSQTVDTKALAAGVDSRLLVYPEMFHVFYVMRPWMRQSQRAWSEIERFIVDLMGE